MRHLKIEMSNAGNPLLRRITNSRAGVLWSMVVLLTGSALLAAAVRAYNHGTSNAAKPSSAPPLLQKDAKPENNLQGRLSLQPEADRFRRRLGQRFTAPGRERATLVGVLTIGAQQLPVHIVRTQNDDGEQVEIALAGGPPSLTWNRLDGAKSAGRDATGIERALIERLALDSPDQFVLAQLRGASYYTVARDVRPSGAGDSDDYEGPLWDLVRIGEPEGSVANPPSSPWRLYYVNTSAGLIDKIVSQDELGAVVAELSGWADIGGESVPTRITWTRDNQVAMGLSVTNAAFGPRQ